MRHWFIVMVLVLTAALPGLSQELQMQALYDIVLTGGRVIDPASDLDSPGYQIGIKGDRIAAVSQNRLRGRQVIDVSGLIVAPGFIDLNSAHLQTYGMRRQATDGVTTALDLRRGRLPVTPIYQHLSEGGTPINFGMAANWSYARIWGVDGKERPDGTLEYLRRTLMAQRPVREGESDRLRPTWAGPAGPEQRRETVGLVEDALRQGALGIALDARYVKELPFEEALDLFEMAERERVPVFWHSHDEDLESLARAVSLSLATGAQLHISDFQQTAVEQKAKALALLQRANALELDLSVSASPFGASRELLIWHPLDREEEYYARIEVEGQALTREELKARRSEGIGVRHYLQTEKLRALSESERNWLSGEKMAVMARDRDGLWNSLTFPGGAVVSGADSWLYQGSAEGFVSGQPLTSEHDRQWPPELPEQVTLVSDFGSSGAFMRFLTDYTQWEGEPGHQRLRPLEAIARLTLHPARILEKSVPQMARKGRLQEGMDADIVAFHPSDGVKLLIVNGELLIRDGKLGTGFPGRAIRRKP